MSTPDRHNQRQIFLRELNARLDQGEKEYGERSFRRPGIGDEILEEILDIAGWAFIAWAQAVDRLEAVEEALKERERRAGFRPNTPH